MRIHSPQHGAVDFEETDLVVFAHGLLGFAELRRFIHLAPQASQPLEFLVAVDAPHLEFPLVDPFALHPDYDVPLGDRERAELGLAPGDALLVYCVASAAGELASATVNLVAPVVINSRSRRGLQVVLEASDYSLAEPLLVVR